jgi:hypothetical protein
MSGIFAGELDYLRGRFAGRTLRDFSYPELAEIALGWVRHVEAATGSAEIPTEQRETAAAADRHVARLRFAELRRRLRPKEGIEAALYELFLMCRARGSVFSYLSLQEGRRWDGEGCEFPQVAALLRQAMLALGKRPALGLSLRLFGLKLRLRLDPACHLRAIYREVLRPTPASRFRIFFHRRCFAGGAWLLRLALRRFLVHGGGLPAERIAKLFQSPLLKRNLAFGILLLFPRAKNLSQQEWEELLAGIARYFIPRLLRLRAAIPEHSVLDHGLVKLCKIAFGVIASRHTARGAEEKDEIRFILNTLRLAYCWGITYPLVDNLLDSGAAPAELKDELAAALESVFSEEPAAGQWQEPVAEAAERLQEVLELSPPSRREIVKRTLLFLLEAHRRDSGRRLSAIAPENAAAREGEVWADSVLKAAFIRIATMEICGTPVEGELLAAQFAASLVNQLGDDLWDLEEDLDDDRVTPFTLQAKGLAKRKAFDFYLRYCLRLTRGESRPRRLAMALGIQDSCRCFFESNARARSQYPELVSSIEAALAGLGKELFQLEAAPHVDPDAVIFAIESTLLDRRG